jgi:hypothetical protein
MRLFRYDIENRQDLALQVASRKPYSLCLKSSWERLASLYALYGTEQDYYLGQILTPSYI